MGHEYVEAENKFFQAPFSEEEKKLTALLAFHFIGSEVVVNHEVKALVLKWEDEQRGVLEEKYGDKSRIWLDWRKGLLYFEAGYTDEAFESLRAACQQALQEFETGPQKAIEADIAKLERQVHQR
jgi:hypothetical protein